MRGPVLALLALLGTVLSSGCVGSSLGSGDGGRACDVPPATATEAGTYGLLVPAAVSDAGGGEAMGERARVVIAVLEGQTLTATAGWVASGGAASPAFDAPEGGVESVTTNSYMWSGVVPAGTYSLEVEGAPFAYQAIVSVTLVATGCPTVLTG